MCETPVSLAAAWRSDILQSQPCLTASVRLAHAWVPFFEEALCVRGFGQEAEIPASAQSPAHSFWSPLTDRLEFPFSVKGLNIWLFRFILLAFCETVPFIPTDTNQWKTGCSLLSSYFSTSCHTVSCVCCYFGVRLTCNSSVWN